jgi:hypothetical protein
MRVRGWIASVLMLLAAGTAIAGPSQDYVLFCQGCHGDQAQGVPGRVPPLAHSLARFMRSPAGRRYVLSVPGAASSALDDAALTGVLNWLAETFDAEDLGPGTPRFTLGEVSATRHIPLLSVLATRLTTVRELETTGPAPPTGY